MAILIFILGAILLLTGLGALGWSIDLVPTDMGRLYAESGVILIGAGAVVFAIAALIVRLDRIFAPKRATAAPVPANQTAPAHQPAAPAEPEIVSRYQASGVNYAIYSDGAIEAETEAGGMRFNSMNELKSYIAGRAGG
jgi:hypothetical protein